MRFDPQANFVSETETVPVAPIMARGPSIGARSPLKTAVAILVIGIVAGVAMWLWTEGVSGRQQAAAETKKPALIDDSIVQYAEAVLSGQTGAERVAAATGTPIEQRLSGAARGTVGIKARDAFERGKTAMGMGDHKGATGHFREAIRLAPTYADAHYRLGLAYVRLGRFSAARKQQAFLKQLDDDRANLLGHLVDN